MIANMRGERTVCASFISIYYSGNFLHLKFMGAQGFLVLITRNFQTSKFLFCPGMGRENISLDNNRYKLLTTMDC